MSSFPSEIEPAAVVAALGAWAGTERCSAVLLNHSENHTFRIDGPEGPRFALRVHRPGYQSVAAINSELAWLAALRRDTDLPLARPIPGKDGALLQDMRIGDDNRSAVLFEFLPGREPTLADDLVPIFERLGHYAAVLHQHAIDWNKPTGFERHVWNAAQILDSDGLWGNWRIAPGVTKELLSVLQELDDALREDLARYGTGPERFGLIHADMRLGNLLVDGPSVSLIDFDDSGFCWFAYDFAAAISFHETEAIVPALKAAWLRGYLPVRPLTEADIAAMDTMVLLRRMALLAWIGSHAETKLAHTHQPGFAEGTAMLARRYLDQRQLARR